MEFAKIVLLSVAAAICYGVAHDQVTARICIEYFTVFHPPIFHTNNPTLLGLGWGVIATWWMGAFLGALLAIASRIGRWPKVAALALIRPVLQLLGIMAASALLFGFTGYILAQKGVISPPEWIAVDIARSSYSAFMADWWAHNASYASAAIGGIVLCVGTGRKRIKSGSNSPRDLHLNGR